MVIFGSTVAGLLVYLPWRSYSMLSTLPRSLTVLVSYPRWPGQWRFYGSRLTYRLPVSCGSIVRFLATGLMSLWFQVIWLRDNTHSLNNVHEHLTQSFGWVTFSLWMWAADVEMEAHQVSSWNGTSRSSRRTAERPSQKMKNLQGASKSSRHMNASNPKENPENKGDSLLLHGNLRTHLIKECRLLKPTVATNTELFDFHNNLWIQTLDPNTRCFANTVFHSITEITERGCCGILLYAKMGYMYLCCICLSV